MAYIKHTWETGEVVSADKLNHMEDCLVDHDENKQGKLTAGQNITISADNTISATGGGGEAITITTETGTLTEAQLAKLQASTDNYILFEYTVESVTFLTRFNFVAGSVGYLIYANTAASDTSCEIMTIQVDTATRAYVAQQKDVQAKLTAGAGISIDEDTNTITSTEKNWYDLTLTLSDYAALNNGEQICGDLPGGAYTGTTFKNDYFKVKLNNTATTEGSPLYIKNEMNAFFVDTAAEEEVFATAQKVFAELIKAEGFEYNYYQTIVYAANATDVEKLTHEGSLEDNNTIYIQDVTQQSWEQNPSEKETEDKTHTRLDKERYHGAYVVSIKGDTNTAFFLISMENAQAAYYNETDKAVRWANVEAYKLYSVTFDTESLRWLLNNVTMEEKTAVAEEMSDAEKARLLNGITFASGSLSAEAFYAAEIKAYTRCSANGLKALIGLFSFNVPFGTPTEEHAMTFFGRPVAQLLESFDYRDGALIVTEKVGEWIWTIPVQGMNIEIVIPMSNPTVYAIQQANLSAASSSSGDMAADVVDIYRHTFTITTDPENFEKMNEGDYAINISFCGVNAQAGDSSMEYVLFSDMNGQAADWILPATGVIGKVELVEGVKKVQTWNTAIRIVAGYHEVDGKNIRCLFIDFFNPTTQVFDKVGVIDQLTMQHYYCRDFRSVVAKVLAPIEYDEIKLAE